MFRLETLAGTGDQCLLEHLITKLSRSTVPKRRPNGNHPHRRMILAWNTNACAPHSAVQAERKPTAAQSTRHSSATPTATANPQILAKQEEDAAAAAGKYLSSIDSIDLIDLIN